MRELFETTAILGLRHILEDGQAFLTGGLASDERQRIVLGELMKFFSKARRGSELVEKGALFFSTQDESAYDSFNLLNDLLQAHSEKDRKAIIEGVGHVFTTLNQGSEPSTEEKEKACSMLSDVLGNLKQRQAFAPQSQPEAFRLNRQRTI